MTHDVIVLLSALGVAGQVIAAALLLATGWLNHDFIQRAAASVPGMDVPRLLDEQKSRAVIAAGKTIDEQSNADNVRQNADAAPRQPGARHAWSRRGTASTQRGSPRSSAA